MDLSCIGDILNIKLPSLIRNDLGPDWYRANIMGIVRVDLSGSHKYNLALPKPYSDKLRYYELIISNCVVKYSNAFLSSFNGSESFDHKKFLVDKYLEREVVQKIRDTATVILEKNLQWQHHGSPEHLELREVIFILNHIKYHLIWLYLEIRNIAAPMVIKDYKDLDSLLAEHFYEYIIESPFITKN